MLFCIDESVLGVLKDERVKDALANLAMSRKKGKHIIYATKKVLDELSRSNELDKMQKDVFKKINSKSVKLKSYLKEFNRRIELTAVNDKISKYKDEFGKQVVKVPIYFLEDFNLVSECMIVLEDINDYKVYKYITDYVLNRRNLTDINIDFNKIPGSGGGIKKVFEEKTKENKNTVISIADTDKTNPNDGMGSTIIPLISYYNNNKNTCLGEVFFREYHEVENLIPEFCYEELGGLTKDEIESYLETATTCEENKCLDIPIGWRTFQLNVYRLDRKDILKYFDFKKGIRLTNLKKENGEKYWSKILCDIGINFNLDDYKPINKDNKDMKIINGFNDKVLDSAFKVLEGTKSSSLDSLLNEDLKKLWDDIGSFLLDWGCGTIPIRAS